MRALILAWLAAAGLAGCGGDRDRANDAAVIVDGGPDLAHPNAGTPTGLSCPCPPGQLCVLPTCCITCPALPADGGSCPDGSTLNGGCSNGSGGYPYCSIPCQANPPFCVFAPGGCSSLTMALIDGACAGNGDYGGYCTEQGIQCIECY